MIKKNYNPDVLSCLANLSNDEVFTPPSLVNQILDLLPVEIWQNKNAKFLDPVTKTGVFLREIVARLNEGIRDQIPDQQERINHILQNQVFGIAITELTSLITRRSLYCSKKANGKYSIANVFKDEKGNIIFDKIGHNWQNGSCSFCGANEEVYSRGEDLETHAYEFIHTNQPESLLNNMKFDVIVGNPPYQISTGGSGVQATPLYHKFVMQAIKLNPRYLTMIIPSRWFSGGFGLDSFRDEMLHDRRMRIIHDYPEASDVFNGVQIKGGVCYFLWDRDNPGLCRVATYRGSSKSDEAERPLLEKNMSTFVRYNEAISILHKIWKYKEPTMDSVVSQQKPFGLPTTYKGKDKKSDFDYIKVYGSRGIGYCSQKDVTANFDLIKKDKIFIPRAGSGSDKFPHPILGKPFIPDKNSICTETYVAIGPYKNIRECESVISYISTKFFRFLVMLMKPTQDALRKVYSLVPIQKYDQVWTDKKLYSKYKLDASEVKFIDSMIKPLD